jgi:hypothetical protein
MPRKSDARSSLGWAVQESQIKPEIVASRVALGVLGGWAFVWGFVTFGTVALVGAGVGYHEALNLTYLLAFLLYLTVFCWAFATRDLPRAWLILAGGAALMTGAAWLLRDIVEVTG